MRPVLTPCSQSSGSRCWIAARPFGIFEKSPKPSRFCSSVNGQWSVEIDCRWSKFSASHMCGWFAASRSGGEQT